MIFIELCASVLFALQVSAPAPSPAAKEAPSLVARIALIGASASAGYNVHISLADALDAQIEVQHAVPANLANEALFLDPGTLGAQQVERAAAITPTLVIAADFLFWFGYGLVGEEADRIEQLEVGLKLLDDLECPLIVSHFPDMTPAVGKLLMAAQVPAPETLLKLNARVDAWAKQRGHVGFVQMPEFIEKLRTEDVLTVGGLEFKGPDAKRRLMQPDDLHPTAEGLAVLGRLCIDAACQASVGAKREEFKADFAPILESLRKLDATRAAAPRPGSGAGSTPPKPKPDAGGIQDAGEARGSLSVASVRPGATRPRRTRVDVPSRSPSPS